MSDRMRRQHYQSGCACLRALSQLEYIMPHLHERSSLEPQRQLCPSFRWKQLQRCLAGVLLLVSHRLQPSTILTYVRKGNRSIPCSVEIMETSLSISSTIFNGKFCLRLRMVYTPQACSRWPAGSVRHQRTMSPLGPVLFLHHRPVRADRVRHHRAGRQ